MSDSPTQTVTVVIDVTDGRQAQKILAAIVLEWGADYAFQMFASAIAPKIENGQMQQMSERQATIIKLADEYAAQDEQTQDFACLCIYGKIMPNNVPEVCEDGGRIYRCTPECKAPLKQLPELN